MPSLQHSLKLRIIIAITLLTAIFASSTLYSLRIIDRQHGDHTLVQLAGRLQFNQQHLAVQAMRYQENAPRDYQSYYRDLKLYFEDLKKTRRELSQIISAFAENRFDDRIPGRQMAVDPQLPPQAHAIARELQTAWQAFLDRLDERIGPDPAEPRLEWAAEWIAAEHAPLEHLAHNLSLTLEQAVADRAERANLVNRLLLALALLVSLGTAVWFYRRVLTPLAVAVEGFRKVANGDFSHRVPVDQNNEIGWLSDAFNQLSLRMDALRKLLTRLEQGADLEGTLRTLSETLPALIPVDWIGVLVFGPDGRIHLEMAFSDGQPDGVGTLSFDPDKTLLEECIHNREPLHIRDVHQISRLSEAYVFLRRLDELGRRDAIFLPIGSSTTVQGVAVFASRYPNSYRAEHLALLRNLGFLVGVSLARTIQLVENSRLASIGQFASGIVHEIRNPLATIRLALDHLGDLDSLPNSGARRVDLASQEVDRLERLLDDILLYAKPLALERKPLDISKLVAGTLDAPFPRGIRIHSEILPCPAVLADRDRLRQVLINLLQNAEQASPDGAEIRLRCQPASAPAWMELTICNAGDVVPEKTLDRVFQPFFTSKRQGTGLGLPIVQRIVAAHGGHITLQSDAQKGTCAILRLPTIVGDAAAAQNQAADEV